MLRASTAKDMADKYNYEHLYPCLKAICKDIELAAFKGAYQCYHSVLSNFGIKNVCEELENLGYIVTYDKQGEELYTLHIRWDKSYE